MSYDYTLMRLDRPAADAADLDGAASVPIGSRAEVVERLAAVFPDVAWDDAGREARLEVDGRWLGVAISGDADEVRSICVRTSLRRDSRDLVERLCVALSCIAFDAQAMRMFSPASGEAWVAFS